jgi:hypothetical protein
MTMDAQIMAVLDDIARRVTASVREGTAPDHDSPHMRALAALSQLYPSVYKRWQDGARG